MRGQTDRISIDFATTFLKCNSFYSLFFLFFHLFNINWEFQYEPNGKQRCCKTCLSYWIEATTTKIIAITKWRKMCTFSFCNRLENVFYIILLCCIDYTYIHARTSYFAMNMYATTKEKEDWLRMVSIVCLVLFEFTLGQTRIFHHE